MIRAEFFNPSLNFSLDSLNSKSDLPLVGLGAVVSLMVLLVVLLLLLSMFKLCVASYNITEIAALELTKGKQYRVLVC